MIWYRIFISHRSEIFETNCLLKNTTLNLWFWDRDVSFCPLSLFLEPSSIVSSFSIELSQQLWCFTDSTRRSEQCSGRYYVTCLPLLQFAQGIPPTNVFLCSFFRWIVICLTTVARITFIVHLNMSAVNMKWVLCTVMKKVHNSYSLLSLATAFQ